VVGEARRLGSLVEAGGPDRFLRFLLGPFCFFIDLVVIPLSLGVCLYCAEMINEAASGSFETRFTVQKKRLSSPRDTKHLTLMVSLTLEPVLAPLHAPRLGPLYLGGLGWPPLFLPQGRPCFCFLVFNQTFGEETVVDQTNTSSTCSKVSHSPTSRN
jgi:hypothetical protein